MPNPQSSIPTIITLPGDGIGGVVLEQALRVLEAAGFEANYIEADIGWEFWKRDGNPLPQKTLDLIQEHKLALFGAITSKPAQEAQDELDPILRERGFRYSSPIVGLRQHFGLDICIRPCRSYAGNPLNFVQRLPDGTIHEPEIDAVIFRQNTEGLYSGVEWRNPPEHVLETLASHPKFARGFGSVPREDLAISTRIFTRTAVDRILRAAFKHATDYGYPSVTVCEKPNVIRETSGLMLERARDIQTEEFPNIELWNTNIDAQMMWLTRNPEDFGVLVAGNMFGDILSDAFAGLVGGLGFASSAQFNPDTGVGVFEPTHGSAPKYANYDTPIVNPIAMLEAACLMLDFIGESGKAARIRSAIATVIREAKVRTYDMLGLRGSPQVLMSGAVSTSVMTDAIIGRL